MLNEAEIDRIDEQVREELPEILQRAQRRKLALQEQTVSGQLRRALADSGLRYREICDTSGLTMDQLDDFMTGDSVPSRFVDALAATMKYQLTPVD